MVLRLLSPLTVAVALLLGGTVAFADDGPPPLLSPADRLRPSETIERLVGAVAGRAVFFLGGYGGTDPHYWDRMKASLADYERFDLSDVPGYDPRGSVAANGALLAREERRHVREDDLDAVALVGVSMGGATIAASGLTSADNVRTETMLGSPVNGSTTAAAIGVAGKVATAFGARSELAAILRPFGAGLDDAALTELAASRDYAPPAGVRLTQFWSAFDPLVTHRDATVPGREVLTLGPITANPHGGHVVDPRYERAVLQAARDERVVVDRRETAVAELIAPVVDGVHLEALVVVGIALVAFAVALHVTDVRSLVRAVGDGVTRVLAWLR